MEISSVSGIFANGDYWIVVDGQDGQLLEYDLTLRITYTGVDCEPLTVNECYSLLPVDAVSLSVDDAATSNVLEWKVSSTATISRFEVERGPDATNLEKVDEVAAIGASSREQQYEFLDRDIRSGLTYYRIKLIRADGTYKYSNISKVYRETESGLALSDVRPNPAYETIQFDYLATRGGATLEVIDNLGLVAMSTALITTDVAMSTQIDITDLPAGVYFLKLTSTNGDIETRRFIKN
jgi:hypothetical protein